MIQKNVQVKLLNWFKKNKRSMPWRGETNPYRIWVSEVMLQQTQVATVEPYYRRFLQEFPTIRALAAAPLDAVLKQWEGLGYYARARNLHRAAREIEENHGGSLPRTFRQLKKLPGFGEYTAGAVASLAFGEPVAAVDGNVKRVLSRIFAITADITRGEGRKQIAAVAAELAQSAPHPGDWTETLMEFGAMVCTPRPHCAVCPVRDECAARRQGIAETLPIKPARAKIPHYDVSAGVIYRTPARKEFLIAQRPLDGMLGGLWEFPGGKLEPGETLPDCLRREIQEELAMEISVCEPVTVVKHAFTHFKITLHAFAAEWVRGEPQKIGVADWAWITINEVEKYAFAHTDRQIITALRRHKYPSAG